MRDNVWLVQDQETEHLVDPREVLQIDCAQPEDFSDETPWNKPTATSEDAVALRVQLATHSGVRLTGRVEHVLDGQFVLRADASQTSISIPVHEIRHLSVLDTIVTKPSTLGAGIARLETSDTKLHGRLVDAPAGTTPTPLKFEPYEAAAVTMSSAFSGRLVYRDPVPELSEQEQLRQQQQQAAQRPAGLWGAVTRAFGNNTNTKSKVPKALYLRSGEIIPCDVTRIDAEGIEFTSELTKQTRLPHDQIRAVQLILGRDEPAIDEVRRERLLTVPRIRKKNPPTHLVVAANGDIMRCRLIQMTEDTIEVETRLETITIDRSVVAQVLWLDEEIPTAPEAGDAARGPANAVSVRAIFHDGNRTSLTPESVIDGELIGENMLLGQCRVRLTSIDELLIGSMLNSRTPDQPYGTWRLSAAPEPTLLDDAGGGRVPGTTSALVGTAAPDFTLDLLDGGRLTLSKQKGKVIVLDFWATWCGPCLQAMPLIEKAVAGFESNDVMLVAVNLQETGDPIHATLKRLKIKPVVALDIDGVAAARYQADAIPQTVIIDREGKISRLFVGGGDKLGDQVTAAIREILANEANAP